MRKLILFFVFLFSLFTLYANLSSSNILAAVPANPKPIISSGCTYDTGSGVNMDYTLTLECIPIMFFNLTYWLLIFSGVVALFLIIFGGFRFMTSGGDPKAVEGARKTIIWAIIGLVVVLLSFAIVAFIAKTTGMSCITKFGFLGTC